VTVSLKHAFTSNVADSGDATLVQPSNWNAEHNLTANANSLLGTVTAGSVTEISCTSAGRDLLDDADAAAQRATLAAAGTGVTNTFTANQIVSVTDNTNAALRITQLGTGEAFRVEDSTNPDSTPFVIKSDGTVGVGDASPTCALDVTGGIKTSRTAVTSPATTDGNIFSGTYTPTGTASTNITAVTTFASQYMRVGNVVTVSGYVSVTTTSASGTFSVFTLTLPIASSLASVRACSGTAVSVSSTASRSTYAQVYGVTATDEVGFNFNCNYAGVNAFYYHFTYLVS